MPKHIIACPVINDELQAVLHTLQIAPDVHLMNYGVHINADCMENELLHHINEINEPQQDLALLVGRHCNALQPIADIARKNNAALPMAQNCIEMILGPEKTKTLQENRTAIMTPGWIAMMQNSIKDGHWTVEDARINMGWYDQILLLDTGTTPLTDELVMSFFDLTEVPIDILKVDLGHFRKVVEQLLNIGK